MAVDSNAVGTTFTADEFSIGTIDSGSQVITFTETTAGAASGPATTITITNVATANGVTTLTAQFAGSTNAAMNGTFTGTVPGNNEASIILTGSFPGGASTNIYLTNTPSQQPGTFGMAMVASEGQGVTYAPQMVCFASGTLIRSEGGDVAVEALAVGDRVVTASGELRPIRWLGHRVVACRRHPRPTEAWPVRIAADAFAPGEPARDLLVSPGHAICVDAVGEVLIPAAALVNGTTIAQVEVDTVTYWHVELDSHDILIAEGLKAESYCEMGNRAFFAEGSVVALAAAPDAGAAASHADFCRPFHAAGAVVDAVTTRLARRAAAMAALAAARIRAA